MLPQGSPPPQAPAVPDATTARTSELAAWLNGLVARADAGDTAALADLKRAYNAVPALWQQFTGLQESAERAVLDAFIGGQLGGREVVERQLGQMKRDLAGPDSSPLERLLAESVVLCWLFATYADPRYAQQLTEDTTPQEGEYEQRAWERAQRPFLRAAQTMATVRRRLAPAAQINIADQQINIAR